MRQGSTSSRYDRQPRRGRLSAQSWGAVACLLALATMLALPVLHTLEHSGAYPAVSETLLQLQTQSGTGATLQGPTASQDVGHNPFLCPICQILSQARPLLGFASISVGGLDEPRAFHLPLLLCPASPALTPGAPRAPPALG